MSRTFDSIIIGSGQAGPFLAARLAGAGQTVALVERKVLGGTCVNTGCTPTKAMVASAKVAHTAREAARFGIHLEGNVQVSLAEVKSRSAKKILLSHSSLFPRPLSSTLADSVRASAEYAPSLPQISCRHRQHSY